MESKYFFILMFLCPIWSMGQAPEENPSSQFPVNTNPTSFVTTSPGAAPDPCLDPPTPPTRPGLFLLDGDFENFGTSDAATCDVESNCFLTHPTATLQDNCISTLWKVSHGTPEVCTDNGNYQIHLWSGDWSGNGDLEGEGIFYDCVLDRCENYEISLKLKTSGPVKKIYFYLVDGIQHKEPDANIQVPESSFFDVPSNFNRIQLIHEIDNFDTPDGNWDEITLPVFSPIFHNMKFWIYPLDDKLNASNGPDLLFVDDVTDGLPGSVSTCDSIINYTTNPVPETTKGLEINASGSVSINSGQNVEFIAGSQILIQPGATINSGAEFCARIVPCVSANNCNVGLPTFQGLKSTQRQDPVIYPNPMQNTVSVQLENIEKFSIRLLDKWNREIPVTYETITSGSIQISLKGMSPGIYYLKLSSSGKVIVERIIIK